MPEAPALAPPRPLKRAMGLLGVLFLTLSAATPASSLFVIVPDVVREAGTGAVLAMALAAVAAAAVSQVYAELASAFPYAGGEYAITARVAGPEAGFAVLAVNLMNSVLTAAVLSLGVAEFLHAAWPAAPALPVALGVVALSGAVGLLDVRAGGGLTGAFLLVELGAVAAVAVAGFLHPERGLAEAIAHPVKLAGGALAATPAASIALAASVALFAYDGYGSAVYFAEELARPRRRVAAAVTLAWACTVAAELVPLGAALLGAPSLPRWLASATPMQDLVAERLGAGWAAAASLAVALAIGNAVIATVLLCARQVYALARDGVWPGRRLNAALGGVGRRSGAPVAGTLLACATAAALCLLPMRLLLVLTGAGITVIYAALCVAHLVGRRGGRLARAEHRAPFFPWLPTVALMALMAGLAADVSDPQEGRPSVVVTLLVAAGGAAWGFRARRSGAWRLTAPADEDG